MNKLNSPYKLAQWIQSLSDGSRHNDTHCRVLSEIMFEQQMSGQHLQFPFDFEQFRQMLHAFQPHCDYRDFEWIWDEIQSTRGDGRRDSLSVSISIYGSDEDASSTSSEDKDEDDPVPPAPANTTSPTRAPVTASSSTTSPTTLAPWATPASISASPTTEPTENPISALTTLEPSVAPADEKKEMLNTLPESEEQLEDKDISSLITPNHNSCRRRDSKSLSIVPYDDSDEDADRASDETSEVEDDPLVVSADNIPAVCKKLHKFRAYTNDELVEFVCYYECKDRRLWEDIDVQDITESPIVKHMKINFAWNEGKAEQFFSDLLYVIGIPEVSPVCRRPSETNRDPFLDRQRSRAAAQ